MSMRYAWATRDIPTSRKQWYYVIGCNCYGSSWIRKEVYDIKTNGKHNWKRITALLTVLVMTLLMAACGSGETAAEESASDGGSAAGMANP